MDRASLIFSLSQIHQGLGKEADAVAEVEAGLQHSPSAAPELVRIVAAFRYGLLQHQNAVCALLSYLERLPDDCDRQR